MMELILSTGLLSLMALIFGAQFARYVHIETLRKANVLNKTPLSYWFSYIATIVFLFLIIYIETQIYSETHFKNTALEILRLLLATVIPLYIGYRWKKSRIESAYK